MKKSVAVTSFLCFLIFFYSNIFSQDKRVSFGIGANMPAGDFSNVYKAGPSAQLGFVFFSLPIINIDLSISAEYNNFSFKNDYFSDEVRKNLGVSITDFNPDWKATDFSLIVGGRLRLPGLILNPYGEAQVGVHFMNFNQRFTGQINASSSDPANISLNGATESASETGFGTAFGIGTEITIIPKMTIDLGFKYNYAMLTFSKSYTVFRNNNSQYTAPEMKNVSYLSAHVGLIVSF